MSGQYVPLQGPWLQVRCPTCNVPPHERCVNRLGRVAQGTHVPRQTLYFDLRDGTADGGARRLPAAEAHARRAAAGLPRFTSTFRRS